jgi:sterol desaturase/sphingolipid hydroxylase (fatty acid hydroxylase superfamily)
MNNLGKNLNQLGRMSVANQTDRTLQRSCIGRVVSMLTFIFILLCIIFYGILFFVLYKTGLTQVQLPEQVQPFLAIGIACSFILAIVLAGLIGDWLRRIIWRSLLRRQR